jgi:hypothetical protein
LRSNLYSRNDICLEDGYEQAVPQHCGSGLVRELLILCWRPSGSRGISKDFPRETYHLEAAPIGEYRMY